MRKKQNCVKDTETNNIQKPVPNTSADSCTLSVSICFQFQFLYIFRVLVFKSLLQTNGSSLIIFFNAIQIGSRFEILLTCLCNTSSNILHILS